MVFVIVFVIALRRPEFLQRHDLGHDGRGEFAVGLELLDGLLGRGLLPFIGVEDDGAVLRPDVVALAVRGGRVVGLEKDVEQARERQGGRVELDLRGLGVAGRAGRDLVVGRVGHVASGVPRSHGLHAGQHLEHGFRAPEAAGGEIGGGHGVMVLRTAYILKRQIQKPKCYFHD